ncbi:MAG: enoyl-CoA hydratase/isomerase family protein [Chloroflexi bacterium]|nr:enoyl-CoA hydratase/isomerase family protein [Chloroflexota bacterium]
MSTNDQTPADYEFIHFDVEDRVATITIDRPDVLNAIHPPASAELKDAWRRVREDSAIWVAILTGAGDRAFCAGMDLKWAAAHAEDRRRNSTPDLSFHFGGMVDAPSRFDVWKPIIAAVNGVAVGGGFEMALACDIVIAAEPARFGCPEVKRGLIAGAGGVHRIPRQLLQKIALGMLLTGRLISAQEAFGLGLVNEVVPQGEALSAAKRWAAEILAASPLAVQATKQAALLGLDRPLAEAIDETQYPAARRLRASEDPIEGPTAFAEKRPPRWTPL